MLMMTTLIVNTESILHCVSRTVAKYVSIKVLTIAKAVHNEKLKGATNKWFLLELLSEKAVVNLNKGTQSNDCQLSSSISKS